jgi:hypothetical protein
MGVIGCFHPISVKVWRIGTNSFAVTYRAPSSASAAEVVTNLMICEMVRIGPFNLGSGLSSEKKDMGTGTATTFRLIVETSVRMGCQYHTTGTVDGATIWIHCHIIEELGYSLLSLFCCRRLLHADCIECN